MKIILIVAIALVLLVAAVLVIGSLLPKEHQASRATRLRRPPEEVWRVLTDYRAFPSWRSNVKSVEELPPHSGLPAWVEVDAHGDRLPLEVVEQVPGRRLVARIADPTLPFGGTWTYELQSVDGDTLLRITERGEVRNPVFRFVSRFLLGHSATIERYLNDLGKKFGGSPAITE